MVRRTDSDGMEPGCGNESLPSSLTVIVGTCSRVIWLVFRYVDVLGSVKKNVDPLPSWESTQMRPPNRSMTFLQIARPIPLPGLS